MPIQIQYKNYTDIFGNTLGYYQANAGDKMTMEMEIQSVIRITSLDSPLQLNMSVSPYEITSPSVSWIEEGFRLGDYLAIAIYDQFATSPLIAYNANVVYIDDQVLGVDNIGGWYNVSNQQIVRVQVLNRDRDTLEILSNHVLNSTAGTEFSLIDGEVTRLKFSNINTMSIGATLTGVQTGLPSGQFETSATLERLANPTGGERAYLLTMDLIQSGVYDDNWFFTSNCLKHFIKFEWASLANEPFGKTVRIFNEAGNTGWFDEAYNTSVIDATLVQGITFLDYQYPTTGQFVVDSASTEFGFGSCYISIDDTYYKNRPFNQNEITIAIPSTDFTVGTPVTSAMNEFGAAYDFEITNITTVGTIHTVDFTFTPNTAMGNWFDTLELGNRQFYIWAKWGNVNLLVFSGQMETQPPIGGFLVPEEAQFFDHSEQLVDPVTTVAGFAGNIEDDIAFAGTFLLDNDVVYESMTARIEAFNTTTLEKFTLNSVFFDFTSVPYSGGQHLLNLTIPVQTQLPTTSVKRDASLFLYPSINTGSQYGINLYFPFLYRWEYWLSQSNADADFYPNLQTKNWYPYDSTGDWTVRLHVELIKDGLAYIFDDSVTIKNYDSDPTIDQTIEIYRVNPNQLVNVIIEGEMHRIVATHTLNDGSAWNPSDVWGMITVEPTESSPRYIVSTVVPYDYNPSNPLEPISGTLVNITYPTPDVAVMECYFNANMLDLSNGVKFTTKIKGCAGTEYLSQKITTTLIDKETTFGENKSIA